MPYVFRRDSNGDRGCRCGGKGGWVGKGVHIESVKVRLTHIQGAFKNVTRKCLTVKQQYTRLTSKCQVL